MSKRIQLAVLAAVAAVAATAVVAAPASAATTGEVSNPGKIGVPLQGSANPYPSTIEVSGFEGPIQRLVVTLHGVTHQKPEDLDILLVAPSGRKTVLASDACGASDTANATWVFASFGQTERLPIDGPCGSGVYGDTNHQKNDQSDSWPGAPGGQPVALNRMGDLDANGTWKLYVIDDASNYAGQIARGWSLGLETARPDVNLPVTPGTFGVASQYPIRSVVSGQPGVITDLDVYVGRTWHERLDDLDMFLVGPQGQGVKLLSDACGDAPVAPFDFWFDDEATIEAPDAGPASVCEQRRVRPTDHGADEQAPGGPPGPWGKSLSAFDLTDPNGEWRLYVYDDEDRKTGWLRGGSGSPLRLGLTTRPRAQVSLAEPAVAVAEGENAELLLERKAQGELGAGSVTITSTAGSATEGTDYRPVTTQVAFAAGDARKTVALETIADELAEGDETLTVTVASGTGDAQPGTPGSAAVTIRDPQRGGGDEADGELDTVIEKAPKGKSAKRRARVRFRATEPGASFECKLDGRGFKPCGSPKRLKRLRAGRHVFLVRAIDATGVADPTPAKRRWRVVGR